MRLQSSLSALLLTAASAVVLTANPTIRVDRDPPKPVVVLSNSFPFGANASGGGDLSFQNGSGNNWTELSVSLTLSGLTPITCGPGPFSLCTITTTPETSGSYLYDIVFGPAPNGGIPANGLFSINLNDSGTDPNGSGSWPKNLDFQGTANVPEPSAGVLVGAGVLGLAGICLYRRRVEAA